METQTVTLEGVAFVAFAFGYAVATFITFRLVVSKWKAIADKWKDTATRYSKTAHASREAYGAAANLSLDQAEAIDAIFQAWEDYRDSATSAPTPESPVEKAQRIATADRTVRTVMGTLHERTGRRWEDAKAIARSLQVPQGPQEGGTVRAQEGSAAGHR